MLSRDKKWKKKTRKRFDTQAAEPNHSSKEPPVSSQPELLSENLQSNLEILTSIFKADECLTIKHLYGEDQTLLSALVYLQALSDHVKIQLILSKLADLLSKVSLDYQTHAQAVFIETKNHALTAGNSEETDHFEALVTALLDGNTIILLAGIKQGLIFETEINTGRKITESDAQPLIRGPKDSFVEELERNIFMIRKRLKDTRFTIENYHLGKISKTKVAVVYLKGIANEELLTEVRARLAMIDTDAILESGYLEEYIEDTTNTPFPTVINTERPDMIVGCLLEGRVALLVDGTPFALLVPAVLIHFFQTAEDYYQRSWVSSAIRLLRYLGFSITLYLPALYIALTTFHQEVLPTPLLISIAAQREGIPFPAFIETLLMEVSFEILHEAGIRMPRTIGPAISIVGALVLGQAAVEAGLVSAFIIIVVAMTATCSFLIPHYELALTVRILRFLMMFLAASFGLYGLFIGTMLLMIHLCNLHSFGIPYTSPLAPYIPADQKDTLIRFPHWALTFRPRQMKTGNQRRSRNPNRRKS